MDASVIPQAVEVRRRWLLFLDSASLEDARAAEELGFVGGITTNPAFMRAVTAEPLQQLEALLDAFSGIVFYQPASATTADIADEVGAAVSVDPNRVVIKLPMTLELARYATQLRAASAHVAFTAVYSPAQVLVASSVGAAWAISYVNRAARLADEGHTLMRRLRATRDAAHTPLELIAASIKSVGEAVEAITNGADTVSVPWSVLEQLPAHPLTETAIAEFSPAFQPSEAR